ncbi:PREDICTED: methyltransferase-like protein 24 [Gavialis gangeticus]|uniref:methyltransferase-like protein 24 n=1 Tax=Gavialis gangeticus TaxID=94835 RepID=UPI00092FA9C2|nr:PREDICTED: methyltransferase-like protein 24 [Gavialis gangeticus]
MGRAVLRGLVLCCAVLSLARVLLRGRARTPGPFTVRTIRGGPELDPGPDPGPKPAPPACPPRYQDENESPARPQTHQDVVPQPWADGSESLQREAERFLAYISTPQLPCSRALSQAGPKALADSTWGPWRVCLDHLPGLAPKPQQKRCLAYTFSMVKRGSEFARRMSEMGCQVHSFGLAPDRRAEERWQEGRVQHHRLWLDWREQPPSASSRRQKSASKRLRRIMEGLGHEKIDVLEADLASAEWKILESILLDGTVAAVHQLILTLHLHWPGFEVSGSHAAVVRHWYSLLKALEARGFRLFHSYKDLQKPQLFLHRELLNASSSYTLSWVNTSWMY